MVDFLENYNNYIAAMFFIQFSVYYIYKYIYFTLVKITKRRVSPFCHHFFCRLSGKGGSLMHLPRC